MDSVPERIENRRHVAVDIVPMMPDVGHGQHQEFGKGPGTIDSHSLRVFAELPAAGQAISATAAHHMAFAAYDVPGKEIRDVGADLHDFADEFMSDDHGHGNRLAGPGIPLMDVKIGTADPRAIDADEHVVNAVLGDGNVFEPQSRHRLGFDKGLHGFHCDWAHAR